jgi:hypothetical protein
VTDPVGIAVPEVSLTDAVNVIAAPETAVAAEAVSLVVVAASSGVTVTLTADETDPE